MKQTAVDWYENEINALFDKYENKEISKIEFLIMKHNLFYPAKEMEKEQMIDAWSNGWLNDYKSDEDVKNSAEHYYNETFNTNEK
jgi:hypothetical protein